MPEITDELIEMLYKKYKPIIRNKIWNYKIRDAGLVDDIVDEVFLIALENNRLRNLREESAFGIHFTYYWFLKGLKKVLRSHFDKSRLLRENEINAFREKVDYLVNNGYSEEEAKEYVIVDESLRMGIFTMYIQPKDNNPSWMDFVTGLLPELKDVDKLFINQSIEFCLNKLKERKNKKSKRDFLILTDYISAEENERQNGIAPMYNITPSRLNQILKRDLPALKKCICKRLDLAKI